MFGCVSAILHFCPERSWRALCPTVLWATSRFVSPETTRRSRQRRPSTLQHHADMCNTTCCLIANTSLTSCWNRTVASMSAGKTDTDNNTNNNSVAVLFEFELYLLFFTLLYIYPSIHLAQLSHVFCERTADHLTRRSFLHSASLWSIGFPCESV